MQTGTIAIVNNYKVGSELPTQNFIDKHFPWITIILRPFLKINNAIKMAAVIFLFVFSTFLQPLYASPQDGVVASGDASINQSGTYTQITQTSDRAIINWQSFNVGSNEHVHFQQPSSSSVTLNRINPANGASQIYGRITATGQVWLTNPAGIFFGPHAQIDVAGLLATTANIHNEDFMAGRHQFTQSPDWHGAIINEGNIRAADYGMVALVAPAVVNRGIIQARLGKIALAAGNEFTVDFYGDQLINFGLNARVTESARDMNNNEVKAGINNTGSLIADGGKILLTAKVAKDIVDNVINMEGVAQAKAVMQKGGEIVLLGGDEGVVRVAAKLDVSGKDAEQQGGSVLITGNKIKLYRPTVIDASGAFGGGNILIGGDYQGKNAAIQNAQTTLVDREVTLSADALKQGNGGKVIVWANGFTGFLGNVYARGGEFSGNGGFVEVSGKENLQFDGYVNTLAPNGKIGTLLLDPKNIIVALIGTAALTDVDQFSETPDQTITISPLTLNAATSAIILQANNDITFSDDTFISDSNATLTVQAGRSIFINGSLSANAAVSFTANETAANGVDGTYRDDGAAVITMAAGKTLSANNNNISFTMNSGAGIANSASGDITLGTITLGTGDLTVTYLGPNNGQLVQVGAITGSSVASATTLDMGSANNITLTNAGNNFGTLSVTSGNNVSILDSDTLNLANVTVAGNLTLQTSSGSISQNALTAITANGSNKTTTLSAGTSGGILLTNAGNDFSILALSTVTPINGTISIRDGSGGLILDNISAANILAIDVTGATTQNAGSSITANAAASFNLVLGGTQTINLTNDNNFIGVFAATGNNVSVKDTGAIVVGSITAINFSITANGDVTQTTPILVGGGGVLTVTAGATNNITLNNVDNQIAGFRVISGNNVSVTSEAALALGQSTISGTLNVDTNPNAANENITQTGAVAVNGLAVFSAGSANVTLNNVGNDFSTVVFNTAGTASIADSNSIIIGASTLSSSLTIDTHTNNGSITQSGLILAPTVTVAAGTGDVDLGTQNNLFTTFSVTSGQDVSVRDNNTLVLGTINTSGALTVLVNTGPVTQSGTFNIGGTTSITTSGGIISLTDGGNVFNDAVSLNNNSAGFVVSITAASDLIFGTTNIDTGSSAFNIISGGSISQTGAITKAGSGDTRITLNNSGEDILLNTQANNFAGSIVLVGSTNTNTRDFGLRNTNALASLPTALASLANLRNLTLQFDNADIALPDFSAVNNINNVSVTAGGTISQIGTLAALGTGTISFTASDLDLDSATALSNASGAITITATDALNLGTTGTGMSITGAELQKITGGTTTLKSGSGSNINVASLTNVNTTNLSAVILDATTGAGGTVNFNGATDFNSLTVRGNSVNLGANITTHGNTLTFDAPVTLTANVALTDDGTTGIIFNDTVNGNFNLDLHAATGDIEFNDLVGNSQRLGAVVVNDAVDVTGDSLFNATSFTQTQGSGTTSFIAGLNTTNNIIIDSTDIVGSYTGNHIMLTGANNYELSVVAGTLTLGGQSGANVTGTVSGIGGVEAALLAMLSPGSIGSYFVNGCLVGTACGTTTSGGNGGGSQNDQTTLPTNETVEDEGDVNTQDNACHYTDPVTQETKKAQGANCVNIDVKEKAEKPKLVQKLSPKPAPYKANSGGIVIPQTLSPSLAFEK